MLLGLMVAVKDLSEICCQCRRKYFTHKSLRSEIWNIAQKMSEHAGRPIWAIEAQALWVQSKLTLPRLSLCLWVDCTFGESDQNKAIGQWGAWVISWITLQACKETSLNSNSAAIYKYNPQHFIICHHSTYVVYMFMRAMQDLTVRIQQSQLHNA